MYRPRYRPRLSKPRAGTRSDWGRTSRDLTNDPNMSHLAHNFWAHLPDEVLPPNSDGLLLPAERAALIQPLYGVDTAVAGISAAQLWGMPMPVGMGWAHHFLGESPRQPGLDDLPHLAFREYRRNQGRPDLVLRQGLQLPRDVGLWGCQITGALETLLAVQPLLPGWKAVAAVDYVLATGLQYADPRWPIQPEDLLRLVDQLPPYTRGTRALRHSLSRAAPNVWSAMETLLRLMLLESGLPQPTCNLRVQLPDGSTAYLDLGWREEMVGVEYNGAVHYRDRRTYGDEMYRLTQFKRLGWDVHICVLADLEQRRRWEALVVDLWRALG